MNDSNIAELGSLFLALSDNTRLKLISLMAAGEVSVGYLAESIGESQPKVSRHLAYLRTAGLVATRREGKHIYYGIEWPTNDVAVNILQAVLGTRSSRLNVGLERTKATDQESIYASRDTSDDTYVRDYIPQEIEIYLL